MSYLPTPSPPKKELHYLYMHKRWSARIIGELYGVSKYIAQRWLREHKLYSLRKPNAKPRPDGDYMYEEYVVKNRTLRDMAKEWKVGTKTFTTWLRDEGIFKSEKAAEKFYGN